jgi:hypothetical protein
MVWPSRGKQVMTRDSITRFGFACTLTALALSCSNNPIPPPGSDAAALKDSVIAIPVDDFFPAMAIGDTVAWQYTASRHSGSSTTTVASGVMFWTVTGKTKSGTITTIQISQAFTGNAKTLQSAHVISTSTITAALTSVTITEDSLHVITITGSASDDAFAWYIPPEGRYTRYRVTGQGDTLVSSGSPTSTLRAKKSVGPIRVDRLVLTSALTDSAIYIRGRASGDTTVIEPPPPVKKTPFDFFPRFSAGDTLSWHYTVNRSAYYDQEQISGIMSWQATSTAATARDTITQILQVFNGTCIRVYGSLFQTETLAVRADTTFVTIKEDSSGRIGFSSSGSASRWWYYAPNCSFAQYDTSAAPGDTLVAHWTIVSTWADAQATRRSGMFQLQFGDGAMAAHWLASYRRR